MRLFLSHYMFDIESRREVMSFVDRQSQRRGCRSWSRSRNWRPRKQILFRQCLLTGIPLDISIAIVHHLRPILAPFILALLRRRRRNLLFSPRRIQTSSLLPFPPNPLQHPLPLSLNPHPPRNGCRIPQPSIPRTPSGIHSLLRGRIAHQSLQILVRNILQITLIRGCPDSRDDAEFVALKIVLKVG